MQAVLAAFAGTIREDEHVALMLDGAGWHGSKALRVLQHHARAAAFYLPEFDRVWLYLHERFLSRRLHYDDEAIAAAASRAWRRLRRGDLTHRVAHCKPLNHIGQTLGSPV
jgi:hypothetical protein